MKVNNYNTGWFLRIILAIYVIFNSACVVDLSNNTIGCVVEISKTHTPFICKYRADGSALIHVYDTCGKYNMGDRIYLTKNR